MARKGLAEIVVGSTLTLGSLGLIANDLHKHAEDQKYTLPFYVTFPMGLACGSIIAKGLNKYYNARKEEKEKKQ